MSPNARLRSADAIPAVAGPVRAPEFPAVGRRRVPRRSPQAQPGGISVPGDEIEQEAPHSQLTQRGTP